MKLIGTIMATFIAIGIATSALASTENDLLMCEMEKGHGTLSPQCAELIKVKEAERKAEIEAAAAKAVAQPKPELSECQKYLDSVGFCASYELKACASVGYGAQSCVNRTTCWHPDIAAPGVMQCRNEPDCIYTHFKTTCKGVIPAICSFNKSTGNVSTKLKKPVDCHGFVSVKLH